MHIFTNLPKHLNDHIMEFASDHRINYAEVLSDLILATHCHACGIAMPVCLIGYVGAYCVKKCWKYGEFYPILDGKEFKCPFGGCKNCGGDDCIGGVSYANSKYHLAWDNSRSPTGVCWRMGDTHKPCNNLCIKERSPVLVPYIEDPHGSY
jgi:hypothetical protein